MPDVGVADPSQVAPPADAHDLVAWVALWKVYWAGGPLQLPLEQPDMDTLEVYGPGWGATYAEVSSMHEYAYITVGDNPDRSAPSVTAAGDYTLLLWGRSVEEAANPPSPVVPYGMTFISLPPQQREVIPGPRAQRGLPGGRGGRRR